MTRIPTTHTTSDVAADYAARTQEALPDTPVAVAVVAAEPLRTVTQPIPEFITGSVTLAGAGSILQLIGANPFRDSVAIANRGDSTVFVGPAPDTLTVAGGYPVTPGTQITLRARRAVYVLADPAGTGNPQPVHFLAQVTDG